MYQHLLLPTDGSVASEAAVVEGLKLARLCGAAVTALHVLPRFHVFTHDPALIEESRASYEHDSTLHGRKLLDSVADNAREFGVECDTALSHADKPYRQILETAAARGCDMIVMASRAHSGLKEVLLGSQTHKVLAHSTVPVLVVHAT